MPLYISTYHVLLKQPYDATKSFQLIYGLCTSDGRMGIQRCDIYYFTYTHSSKRIVTTQVPVARPYVVAAIIRNFEVYSVWLTEL